MAIIQPFTHRLGSLVSGLQGHITSLLDAGGHVTDEDDNVGHLDLVDNCRIMMWKDYHGGNKLVQETAGDMPRWESGGGDKSIFFSGSAKYMSLNTVIGCPEQEAFSIAFHLKCSDFAGARTIIGTDSNNFLMINEANTFYGNFGGGEAWLIPNGESVLPTDEYFTVIFTRTEGEEGIVQAYVWNAGGELVNADWTSEPPIDNGEIEFARVGCDAADTNNFLGKMQHISWYGKALGTSERNAVRDYIINTEGCTNE